MSKVNRGRSLLRDWALAMVAGVAYYSLALSVGSVAGTSELLENLTGSQMDALVWITRAATAYGIAALLPAFVLHAFTSRHIWGWAVVAAAVPMVETVYYRFETGIGFDLYALVLAACYVALLLAWIALFRVLAMRARPHCPVDSQG